MRKDEPEPTGGDLADTTARIFVQRNVEFLDQLGVRALDPVRHVLGGMGGGLGHVMAEVAHDLVAHHVAMLGRALAQGVGIALVIATHGRAQ